MEQDIKIKYTEEGNEIGIIKKFDNFVVGFYLYEDEKGNVQQGEAFIIETKLYDKPPIKKYEQSILLLKKDLEKLNEIYEDKAKELDSIKKEIEEYKKTYNQYAELKCLNMFIEGKLKYYVIEDYSDIYISKFEHETSDCENGKLKLLTLFGKTDGNLQWNLNQYSDGSGSCNNVYPFCSYEEAYEKAKELIIKKLDFYFDKKIDDFSIWSFERLLKSAKKIKMKIDKKYLVLYKEMKLSEIKKEKVKLNEKIVNLEEEQDRIIKEYE